MQFIRRFTSRCCFDIRIRILPWKPMLTFNVNVYYDRLSK